LLPKNPKTPSYIIIEFELKNRVKLSESNHSKK